MLAIYMSRAYIDHDTSRYPPLQNSDTAIFENASSCSLNGRQEYLKHKHIGGASFQKGNNYENRFSVWKLAELLNEHIDFQIDGNVEAQKKDFFIDDLVIDEAFGNFASCFQLKNRNNVGWGNGKKSSLSFDCFWQEKESYSGQIKVVINSSAACRKLQSTKPVFLSNKVQILTFPNDSLEDLLDAHEMKDVISKLCAKERPENNLIRQVALNLLAVWQESNGCCSISSLATKIASIWPSTIRVSVTDTELKALKETEFAKILSEIPNFNFDFRRGYFNYEYFQTKATFNHHVKTKEFADLQDWVIQNSPEEFEDKLEMELLRRSLSNG